MAFGVGWQALLLGLPGLLAAIVLHEYAHAWAATQLGDVTPRLQGRLTLNPLAHIDWIGALMLFTAGFGWARPVQVNPWNFADRRRDMILVAVAGPAANLLIALAAMLLEGWLRVHVASPAFYLLELAVAYNVFLAIFNILPIPPLDGSKVLINILPPESSAWVESLTPHGWLILILLVASGFVGRFLTPLAAVTEEGLRLLAGAMGGA